MTLTEDQIIAEAVRLAKCERHQYEPQTLQSVARYALRLATHPEHYHAPPAELLQWARSMVSKAKALGTVGEYIPTPKDDAARYILKMAGEKQ